MPDQHQNTKTCSSTESEDLGSSGDSDIELQPSDDLQLHESYKWKIKWRLLLIFPVLSIIAVAVPTSLSLHETVQTQRPFGCDPAGNVWVAGGEPGDELSLWNLAFILNPTITLWRTGFTKAKVADLCWDVFVGRGVSALSALLVYNVFRVVLTDIMRNSPLPQDQLLAAQYSTTSVLGLWTYVKAYARGLRGIGRQSPLWISLIWFQLISSVIYVLVTPTWLSAMTSYQATTYPVLQFGNNYTSLENLISCRFRIRDGHRIGLPDNICVPTSGSLHDAVQKYVQSHPVVHCYGEVRSPSGPQLYGSPAYFPASFTTASLPRRSCGRNSSFERDGQIIPLASPVLHIGGIQYAHNGHIIDATSLQRRSICQSSQIGEYEWGVSFLLLFSFMVATVAFMLSIFLTWLKFFDHAWPQQVDLVFGNIRTALIVGTSVRDLLGDKVDDMTENDIKESLSRMKSGVRQNHARSEIMSVSGPRENGEKDCSKFVVGSEAYKNYLVHGYDGISRA